MIASLLLAAAPILAIPAAWTAETPSAKARMVERIGAWNDGPDAGERITLDATPSQGWSLAAYVRKSTEAIKRDAPSVSILSSAAVQLCDGIQGWKQTFSDSNGGGITAIYAVTRARAYVAIFTYPAYPGPSKDGEAAIDSLCPPPDPIVHQPPAPIDAPPWPAQDSAAYFLPAAGWTTWVWDLHAGESISQRVVVGAFPMPPGRGGLSYGLTSMMSRYAKGKATVLQRSPVRLCRGLDGVYVSMLAAAAHGTVALEAVMTFEKGRAYAAMYFHPAAERPRPEAKHAIRSLCPAPP